MGFLDGSLEVPPLRASQQRLDVSSDPELRPVLIRLLQIIEPLHSVAGKWFVAHDHLLSLDGYPAGIYRTVNEGVTVCPGFHWPRSGRSASLTRIRRQEPWFEVPGNLIQFRIVCEVGRPFPGAVNARPVHSQEKSVRSAGAAPLILREGGTIMASGTLRTNLNHLRDLFDTGTAVGLGDAELLRRYADAGDGSAFETLVIRYGPMVASTCRAILRDPDDAEDVFQATFLVLARKAGSIRAGEALGGWLLRVASRAAMQRNIEARRRPSRLSETDARQIPDPSRPSLDFDVRAILHQELDRLPDAERLPVVLCDLEGLTYDQAAARLGSTAPKVYHRLAKGRKRLRDRLIRRGVSAGAISAALDLARPSAVAASWSRAALAAATGGTVPAGVSILARSLIRSLLMNRIRSVSVAAVLVLGSIVSVGLVALGAAGNEPTEPPASVFLEARSDEPDPTPQPTEITVEARDLLTDAPMPDVKLDLSIWTTTQHKSSATTDASGTARIPLPAAVRSVYIGASRDGLVRESFRWSRKAEAPRPPDHFLFQMEKATIVRGRVVDPDGKSVAGATVVIAAKKTYPRSKQWVNFGYEKTKTDVDGRWSFIGIPEKPDSIELAAYDYLHLAEWPYSESFYLEAFRPLSALRDGSATLRLPPRGTTIEGTVVDPNGQPVAGGSVTIGDDGGYANRIPPIQADDRGQFRLGMKPGTNTSLMARSAGFGPVREAIRVGREPQRITLRLPRAHTVSGQAVDPEGKPIAGAGVGVRSWRGGESLQLDLKTDAEGRFTWNEAPGDEVKADVSAVGYATAQGVSLRPGEPVRIVLKRPTTIKGTVVDAATGRPIPTFRLGIGTVWHRTEHLIWQHGDDIDREATKTPGAFEYTLYERADQYDLRVSADGYLAANSGRFAGDGEPRSFAFRLVKGEPVRGTLLGPDGSPAVGAIVSLVPAEQPDTSDYADFRNGEIEDRTTWPEHRSKVGLDGHFTLAPQRGNFALVATSDAGYAIVHSRDLPEDHTLQLQRWASITGTIKIDGKPAAKEMLLANDENGGRQVFGEPRLDIRYNVQTDVDGRFALRRVMAGRRSLRRMSPNGAERRFFYVPVATIDVEPGRSYSLRIGESGRMVTGNLQIPENVHAMVRKASIELKAPKGRESSYGVELMEKGRFRALDLPPGTYSMKIALHEPPPPDACGWGRLIAAYEREFSVSGSFEDPPLDLGTIAPRELGGRTLKVGEKAPGFAIETLDGKRLGLGDFRGKFLLLDFWATWCAPCVAELPNLSALQQAFGSDSRFAIVSMSLDERPDDIKSFIASEKMTWTQACVGPDAAVVDDYGATAIPSTFLIGPDGTIVASGLRGDALRTAIEKALRGGR